MNLLIHLAAMPSMFCVLQHRLMLFLLIVSASEANYNEKHHATSSYLSGGYSAESAGHSGPYLLQPTASHRLLLVINGLKSSLKPKNALREKGNIYSITWTILS